VKDLLYSLNCLINEQEMVNKCENSNQKKDLLPKDPFPLKLGNLCNEK